MALPLEEGPRGQKLRKNTSSPGEQMLKWCSGFSWRDCSILAELRTGHVGLNAFLARVKAVADSL